jgi:2-phosphosulfolactate phosphatase
VAVVVDAFRASTTIAVLVSKGARVIPVSSIREASEAEADFRIGERGSAKVAGFDFGNSPTEIQASEIPRGSTVVLSTTNGTRVVEAAAGAPSVLTGAFVNAEHLAAELADGSYGDEIVAIGCGWEGHRFSEDEAAAGAILHHLRERGATLDERGAWAAGRYLERAAGPLRSSPLRANRAARRLIRLGYEPDLDFCLSEDTLPVAPLLTGGAFSGRETRSRGS